MGGRAPNQNPWERGSIKERAAGLDGKHKRVMPRRCKEGALASYFYDAGTGDSKPSQPPRVKAPAAKPATTFLPRIKQGGARKGRGFLGPHNGEDEAYEAQAHHHAAPEHHKAHAPKHEPVRSKRKETVHLMKTELEIMKKNYKDTELIFEAHKAWPLSDPYDVIEAYILECKGVIHDARTHTGAGRHKLNVEAVHAARIDTSNWDFASIHDPIVQSKHQAPHNHLKLAKPHHHADGTHLYVHVVLAWLFAAKSQLMSNLAAYIRDQGHMTPKMEEFLGHDHKGREALDAYHKYKHELPLRKRKQYELADQTLLDEQYRALHG